MMKISRTKVILTKISNLLNRSTKTIGQLKHIAGDQTRRAAAVWTLNILLPKFHALTIKSGKVYKLKPKNLNDIGEEFDLLDYSLTWSKMTFGLDIFIIWTKIINIIIYLFHCQMEN